MDLYFLAFVSALIVSSLIGAGLGYLVSRARHIVRYGRTLEFLRRGGHGHARRKSRQDALRRILSSAKE